MKYRMLSVLTLAAVAAASGLTDAERKEGLAHLDRTRAGVVQAAEALSEAQWGFKPAPGQWSIAEIVEHIALTEDLLFEHISKNVMQAPPGKPDRDYKSGDRTVLTAIASRDQKAQAPEPVVPTGRWSPRESIERFQKSRARSVEFLKSASGLRDHVTDSPVGALDAYQWLLYASAHAERHTKQILEVKSDPNFPKE